MKQMAPVEAHNILSTASSSLLYSTVNDCSRSTKHMLRRSEGGLENGSINMHVIVYLCSKAVWL
jgi:hypothetical protein